MRNLAKLMLTVLVIVWADVNALDLSQQKKASQIVVTEIDSELKKSRLLVQELAHQNTDTLNQFDIFAETLKKTYLAGEGLIDKDILRIIDAINFSAEKHRFQIRKSAAATPYIIHPIGVANSLMTLGKIRDPDIIIGGLLHDTVEDTETTFEEIDQRFGKRVTDIIREVTDDKSLPKMTRKQLQIEHAPHKSAGAAQIKLADKLYNLTDMMKDAPVGWDQERLDAYFKWAQSVVDALPWVNAPLKQAVDNVFQNYWQSKNK